MKLEWTDKIEPARSHSWYWLIQKKKVQSLFRGSCNVELRFGQRRGCLAEWWQPLLSPSHSNILDVARQQTVGLQQCIHCKEEHLLVFFVAGDRRRAGVTRRRRPARQLRHSAQALVEETKVKVFRPKQRTCLTQDLHLCARRTFHWLCGAICSQNQPGVLRKWAMVSYAKDLWRLWQDVTQDSSRPAWLVLEKINDFFGDRFNIMTADLQLDTACGAQLRKIRLVGG